MANVKPGDLAIVVAMPDVDPRGFMAPVTVLRAGRPMYLARGGFAEMQSWIVYSPKPFMVRAHPNDAPKPAHEFAVPDAYLRRVPPDVLENETTDVKEKETT